MLKRIRSGGEITSNRIYSVNKLLIPPFDSLGYMPILDWAPILYFYPNHHASQLVSNIFVRFDWNRIQMNMLCHTFGYICGWCSLRYYEILFWRYWNHFGGQFDGSHRHIELRQSAKLVFSLRLEWLLIGMDYEIRFKFRDII